MNTIEGYVLAGGQSRRMGRDKAEMPFMGTTLLDHAARTLLAIASHVYVIGARAEMMRTPVNCTIIPDDPIAAGRHGAIIGLYTALAHARGPWIAVLAFDLPFAGGELLIKLATMVPAESNAAMGAIIPAQGDGRIQPLAALYRPEICLPVVEQMINRGQWRLQEIPAHIKTRIVKAHDLSGSDTFAEHAFLNINTPDDYEAALALIPKGGA